MKQLLLVLFSLASVLFTVVVAAGEDVYASGWESEAPSVVSRAEIPNAAPQDMFACRGTDSFIEVENQEDAVRACVFGSISTLRIARYGQLYAVAFPKSNHFYELQGICPIPKCVYSPSTDSLLSHYYRGNSTLGLALYKNVSKYIKRHIDIASMRQYFQFEPAHAPDFTLEAGDIQPRAESAVFSQNGKYALIEMRSYGLARLNTDTLELRRVVAPSSTYGLLNDPYYELAITNDGVHVAVAGYRAHTALYVVDELCGDVLDAESGPRYKFGSVDCRQVTLDINAYFPTYYQSFNPRFNDDGSRLGVSVLRWDGVVERLVFGYASKPLDYLALGDSFTSGEGEQSDAFYKSARIGGDIRCHVSTRSYPDLLSLIWNVQGYNVACSGAITRDIIAESDGYLGQSNLLSGYTDAQVSHVREEALGYFQSGIIPQLSFVSQYQPRLATLGISGNDVGLINKLSACLNIDICEWVSDVSKRRAIANELALAYPKVQEVISELRMAAPKTKVVVIGYPLIINDSQNAVCDAVLGTLLQPDERRFIIESIRYLNQVIKAAAYSQGVAFIDTETAFGQNKLCDSTNAAAMNGIRFGDDIAPITILKDFRIIGAESFHPTAVGHEYLAEAIKRIIPSVDIATGCGDCSPSSAPMPSEYWGDESIDYVNQVEDTLSLEKTYRPGSPATIAAQNMLFMPNSPIVVEIHSKKERLLVASAGDDGSFGATVTIPATILPGYHTIHLLGTAPDGEPVDVYSTVAIIVENTSNANYSHKTGGYLAGTERGVLGQTSFPPKVYTVDTSTGVMTPNAKVDSYNGSATPPLAQTKHAIGTPLILPLVFVAGLILLGVIVVALSILLLRRRRYSHDRGG